MKKVQNFRASSKNAEPATKSKEPNKRSKKNTHQHILKPWGEEIWFAYTDHYAGKILKIKKGHRYSLQYHEKKQETQYLFKGKIKMTVGKNKENLKEIILHAGDKMDILPWVIHRAEALEESLIFEVSTPELDDVVKIEDDYGRSGKGNNETLDKKLALKNAKKH